MWLGALLSSLFVSLVNRFQCFPLEFLIALQSYAFFSIPAIFHFTFLSCDVHLLRIWKLIILFPQKLHTLSCWFQRVVFAVSTCCISSFNVLCLWFQRVVSAGNKKRWLMRVTFCFDFQMVVRSNPISQTVRREIHRTWGPHQRWSWQSCHLALR